MSIKPNEVDDFDLFTAYTGKDIDDYEPEDIEDIINKAHSEYEDLLKATSSDDLGINVLDSITGAVFSFTMNDVAFPYSVNPVIQLMFDIPKDVEEIQANKFVVSGILTVDALKKWLGDNTPFTNITAIEKEEPDDKTVTTPKSNTVNVGGVDVTINALDDEERLSRMWGKFASNYDEDHRVLVTVRNEKFHAKVTLKLMFMFGDYSKNKWDIFYMTGDNRTIQTQIDERREENDATPVTYIVGIKNDVSVEKVQQFQKSINRLKLTN